MAETDFLYSSTFISVFYFEVLNEIMKIKTKQRIVQTSVGLKNSSLTIANFAYLKLSLENINFQDYDALKDIQK